MIQTLIRWQGLLQQACRRRIIPTKPLPSAYRARGASWRLVVATDLSFDCSAQMWGRSLASISMSETGHRCLQFERQGVTFSLATPLTI